MKRNLYWLPVALAFLIGMAAAGCGNKQKPEERLQRQSLLIPMKRKAGSGRRRARLPKRPGPIRQEAGRMTIFFREAQNHIYTQEELSDLTREELRIARNEIYAKARP